MEKRPKKKRGPRQNLWVSAIEVAMTVLLVAMILGGLVLVFWALVSLYGHKEAQVVAEEVAFKGLIASVFLTGITTIYCGLTGFILLENRRMRVQAVMPHVQIISPLRSGDSISLELTNSGAAPAVDVAIVAWVMTSVGQDRTPEAAIWRGSWPALPATHAPSRMQLIRERSGTEFNLWRDHLARSGLQAGALDPLILLLSITYRAVSGAEVTDCMALALSDQPPVPGGNAP